MAKVVLTVALALTLYACGGGSPDSPPAGPAALTIRDTGVQPASVTIGSSGTVNVTNADPVNSHALEPTVADPGCPASGSLAPNQTWPAHFAIGPYACSYRDSAVPGDTRFHATVNVVAPGTKGY